MKTEELVCLAARLADEKKAEDIRVLDLQGQPAICDYVVIATVTSKPHLDAVEEEVTKKLKEHRCYKLNRDGRESNCWRISDYGSFLLHLMTQEAREHFQLDELFASGKRVDFTKPVKKTVSRKTVSKKTTRRKTTTKSVKKTVGKKTTVKKTTAQTGKKTAARRVRSQKTSSQK